MSYGAKATGQLRLSIHNIVLEELGKCSYSSWRENVVMRGKKPSVFVLFFRI